MNRMTEIEARVGELVAKRRELFDEIRRLEEIPDHQCRWRHGRVR
jgi:hypothetical protein